MLVWDDEGNMGIMIGCSIGGGALVPGIGGASWSIQQLR